METTKQNLKEAFAGESQAYQKYKAFAKQAAKEGFPNISKLFETTAEAEKIHAESHLKAMGQIGSTSDNLMYAIEGETYEFKDMYPKMFEDAQKEGSKSAVKSFEYALKAEAVHAKIYQMALQALTEGKDLPTDEIYLCPVCGDIEIGKPERDCPICGLAKEKYIKL
jgi:rubrerythrin